MTITRRQRVLSGLRRKADNITWTLDMGAVNGLSEYMLNKFYKKYGNIEPKIFFNFDIRPIDYKVAKRQVSKIRHIDEYNIEEIDIDEWGMITKKDENIDISKQLTHPLDSVNNISEIINYPLPIIIKKDISKIIDGIKEKDLVTTAYGGSLYEWSWWLRGMENLLIDIGSKNGYDKAIFDKVTEHVKNLSEKWVKAGIDIICFYDDIGMQDRLQIRPQYWRKAVKPRYKRIIKSLKKINPKVLVFLHTCGKVTEVIEDFIEMGVDILNPLQPECMPLKEIKDNYKNDLSFWGTVSNQRTLSFGNKKDIFEEVANRIEIFGPNGIVIAPNNILGKETPWQSVEYFVEACTKLINN